MTVSSGRYTLYREGERSGLRLKTAVCLASMKMYLGVTGALVAQWIEQWPPEPRAGVRVSPRAPFFAKDIGLPETTRCFNCTKEVPAGVDACPVCGFTLSGSRIESIKEATELNSRAQLHDSRGKWDESIPMYQRAVELYPEFVVAHYNLGIALGKDKRFDDAKEALTEAIKLKPDFAAAYTARGDIDAGASDYDAAVRDFSKALELYPDYAQAYYKRALSWIAKGVMEEARQDLEDYLFYKPHDARARRRLEKLKEGA